MVAPTGLLRDERGAGSILGVAILAAVFCLAALLIPLQLALATKQSVASAADAAALAAADVRVGIVAGVPCQAAAHVAAANGASLGRCELDGLVATVLVSRTILGVAVSAAATAGPPGSGGD